MNELESRLKEINDWRYELYGLINKALAVNTKNYKPDKAELDQNLNRIFIETEEIISKDRKKFLKLKSQIKVNNLLKGEVKTDKSTYELNKKEVMSFVIRIFIFPLIKEMEYKNIAGKALTIIKHLQKEGVLGHELLKYTESEISRLNKRNKQANDENIVLQTSIKKYRIKLSDSKKLKPTDPQYKTYMGFIKEMLTNNHTKYRVVKNYLDNNQNIKQSEKSLSNSFDNFLRSHENDIKKKFKLSKDKFTKFFFPATLSKK